MTTQFTPGKTYTCTAIGDHNCKWSFVVAERTAKRVTLMGIFGGSKIERKVFGVKEYNGCETIKPLGNYSMSPTLFAR